MNKEKISSQEIIDLVASKASVSKRAAEEFLKVMIASVEEALLAGEVVKIKNFGTFKLQWNEPRKSVNIQTGEEIMLIGYYKVVFIPDAVLKEQVNEPFAHLEPVELDMQTTITDLKYDNEVATDPLRIFNEQATEIKSLISEIQALTPTIKSNISEEETVIEKEKENEKSKEINPNDQVLESNKEADLELLEEERTLEDDNIQVIQSDIVENNKKVEPISKQKVETQLSSDLPVTPYLNNIKRTKKSKIRLLVLVVLFSLTGLTTVFYLFYPPATEYTQKISTATENLSISEMINTISNWFAPTKQIPPPLQIVIPRDTTQTDSVRQNIDSLQFLFDNPRVYEVFITSERIKAGSRLTLMSKRYYGIKDFWVYIYEANKEHITNPDNIAIGTLIRIPKMDARLIDATNPRCLKKAKELHDIYIK